MIKIWPGVAPGSEGKVTPEQWINSNSDPYHRVTNVHEPSLTIYLPAEQKAVGAALIIAAGRWPPPYFDRVGGRSRSEEAQQDGSRGIRAALSSRAPKAPPTKPRSRAWRTFDGPPNWYLARRHHDGHFYFIDCKFSERMRDQPPYRQMYPLPGRTPTQSDIDRNKQYDRTNKFGDRNYFFNSRRDGGD